VGKRTSDHRSTERAFATYCRVRVNLMSLFPLASALSQLKMGIGHKAVFSESAMT
jgi:DNA phosphorothioation-dependent restriction protein DptG